MLLKSRWVLRLSPSLDSRSLDICPIAYIGPSAFHLNQHVHSDGSRGALTFRGRLVRLVHFDLRDQQNQLDQRSSRGGNGQGGLQQRVQRRRKAH